jgi:ribonuclease Z
MMELLFLGTSAGGPTKTRNMSAIVVIESQGSGWYLIDCGEATQHQLLYTHLSLHTCQGLFITHVHGDHCYGLPGLLASAGTSGRKAPLKIVAPQGIREWFEATQIHTRLHLPFELIFIAAETLTATEFGQFTVSVSELSHRVPSFAYVFTETRCEPGLDTEKLKAAGIVQGPLWGKIQDGVDIEYQGKVFASHEFIRDDNLPRKMIICGDNDRPELLEDICRNCHVLVHEATFTKEIGVKVGAEVKHSYAEQIAEFAEAQSIPHLVLTHFSSRYSSDPNMSPSIADIEAEASAVYSGQLYLAQDFNRYRLDKSGKIAPVTDQP